MDELKIILEKKLSSNSTSDWISLMEKEKIPCGPIFNIKQAVENPQIESRNMSNYKDSDTRGEIPDLDEHRKKIIEEFCN